MAFIGGISSTGALVWQDIFHFQAAKFSERLDRSLVRWATKWCSANYLL